VAQRRKEKRTDRSKLDATPPWETRVRETPPATEGPYDERDAPEDGITRVDLGALRVPMEPGIDMRLDLNEAEQVVAVTLASPHGNMQLGVFAAPRNEGIWDDVRAEIATSINQQKGGPKERHDGPFGVELTGRLPGDGGGPMPVRFIGVDGPRWFLRAMLIGAVAAEPAKAHRFEKILREVVVVRGVEPLPVREPVPLRLPREAVQQLSGDEVQGESEDGSGT
jgi:Protein of unknown function (DUF3710)